MATTIQDLEAMYALPIRQALLDDVMRSFNPIYNAHVALGHRAFLGAYTPKQIGIATAWVAGLRAAQSSKCQRSLIVRGRQGLVERYGRNKAPSVAEMFVAYGAGIKAYSEAV